MVIKRLTKPWKPIAEMAGAWGDMSPKERKEMDDIFRRISEANRKRDSKIRELWG